MALGHWAKTYLNPNGGGTELPSVTASDNGKVLGVDGGEYKLVEQSGGDGFVEYSYSGGGKYYLRKSGNIVEVIFDGVHPNSNKYSDIKLPFPSGFAPSSSGAQINSALTVVEYDGDGQGQPKPKVVTIVRNGENTFGIGDSTTGTFADAYVYGYGAYRLA